MPNEKDKKETNKSLGEAIAKPTEKKVTEMSPGNVASKTVAVKPNEKMVVTQAPSHKTVARKGEASKVIFDLLIIGGGVNGTSIVRDASGRKTKDGKPIKAALFEMDDIAWATSSSSTKLLHGGLRYLEYFEFRLVREALQEREILFETAPHIAWRKRFIFPYRRSFTRPKTAVRMGLYLYDHLAKLRNIQKSKGLNLKKHMAGLDLNLKGRSKKAYEYSDLYTLDSKFCVLNAVDGKRNGAEIYTRHKVIKATRNNGVWHLIVKDINTSETKDFYGKVLVNTAGPWINQVIDEVLPIKPTGRIKMVQGSHIIVPKMFTHEYGYFLTTDTKRIVFALPYEDSFTMIGTTDTDYDGDPGRVKATKEEKEYLVGIVNSWFKTQIKVSDIIWDFSGVRALYDDGKDATSATRDYVIKVDADENDKAPVLCLFGGKITAAREIGEKIVNKLANYLNVNEEVWTRKTPLIGGEFDGQTFEEYAFHMCGKYPHIPINLIHRLVRHYGTRTNMILGNSQTMTDLGTNFGEGLTEAEVKYMIDHEFAQQLPDVIWRRTRLGIRLNNFQQRQISDFITKYMNTKK